ncbi:MAG: xylulokinase [Fretibacterium sp.]|nr:xylulokinase [Fretibacterium sp.]
MRYFLGIDLGTSSVKSLLMDEGGGVAGVAQRGYDIQKPQRSWAEQDMVLLWGAVAETLRELMGKNPSLKGQIAGIGFSGQMHGLVALGRDGEPVRRAIIWADQRSQDALAQIAARIPDYRGVTLNSLSTGFLLSSLLWVREHEPDVYERTRHVMLPKDYIRCRMCGEMGTDCSDASGTAAFNTAKREWAWDMIQRLGLDAGLFVPCHDSWETAGRVTRRCAEETGLPEGVPIVYGGGDTLVQAVGNGLTEGEAMISNIGTASQLLCLSEQPLHDPEFRTNTFCHAAPGSGPRRERLNSWLLMGANLTGGVALKWLRGILGMDSYEQMTELAFRAAPGSEGLIFLPYLNGERTPWNDPNARGILFGLSLKHGREELIRSVMEGIVLAQRETLEIFRQMGLRFHRVIASGGGARSLLFRKIIASALGCEVITNAVQEQGCVGAAILAAVGTGAFSSIAEACARVVRFDREAVEPDPEWAGRYDGLFAKFHELYPANKTLFGGDAG